MKRWLDVPFECVAAIAVVEPPSHRGAVVTEEHETSMVAIESQSASRMCNSIISIGRGMLTLREF